MEVEPLDILEYIEDTGVEYTIACISWNTESIPIGVRSEEGMINRGLSMFNYGMNLIKPDTVNRAVDFFDDMKTKFLGLDVVVFSFQEDASPGSHFHSHFLNREMPNIGYTLLHRTVMMGIGETTITKGVKRGLRISVYLRSDLHREAYSLNRKNGLPRSKEYVCGGFLDRQKQGKGGCGIYFLLPGLSKPICIVDVHLPFKSESVTEYRKSRNIGARDVPLQKSNACFNQIYENFVMADKNGIGELSQIVIMGDMNYRISSWEKSATIARDMSNPKARQRYYQNYDELLEQIKSGNIYPMLEGVNNAGPTFIPTCRMAVPRSAECQAGYGDLTECFDYFDTARDRNNTSLQANPPIVPSWCDRILYNTLDDSNGVLTCDTYDRIDVGRMAESDHAGVYALLTLVKE